MWKKGKLNCSRSRAIIPGKAFTAVDIITPDEATRTKSIVLLIEE